MKLNLKNLKIKHKLLINFLISLFFLLFLAGMSYKGMLDQKNSILDVNIREKYLDKIQTIHRGLLDAQLTLQRIVNWTGAGFELKSIKKQIQENKTKLIRNENLIKELIKSIEMSDAQKERIRELKSQLEALNKRENQKESETQRQIGEIKQEIEKLKHIQNLYGELLPTYQAYKAENENIILQLDLQGRDISIVNMFLLNVKDTFEKAEKKMMQLHEALEKLNVANFQFSVNSFNSFIRNFLIIVSISIVLSLLMYFFIKNGITRPIGKFIVILREMTRGGC
jgi:DNA repair exonuclease SbcCD ATPase subunit